MQTAMVLFWKIQGMAQDAGDAGADPPGSQKELTEIRFSEFRRVGRVNCGVVRTIWACPGKSIPKSRARECRVGRFQEPPHGLEKPPHRILGSPFIRGGTRNPWGLSRFLVRVQLLGQQGASQGRAHEQARRFSRKSCRRRLPSAGKSSTLVSCTSLWATFCMPVYAGRSCC